jgi:hypothetical protein
VPFFHRFLHGEELLAEGVPQGQALKAQPTTNQSWVAGFQVSLHGNAIEGKNRSLIDVIVFGCQTVADDPVA